MQEQKQHEGRPDRGGRNLALLGSIVLAAMTFVTPAQAALTFVFTYTDPAGVGFNHAVDGPARKTALSQTATLLANMFPTLHCHIFVRLLNGWKLPTRKPNKNMAMQGRSRCVTWKAADTELTAVSMYDSLGTAIRY